MGGLDVRCAAICEDSDVVARCQLYIGHETAHALLVLASGQRQLWLWRRETVAKSALNDGIPVQLPWAPGCPQVIIPSTLIVDPALVDPAPAI
jgi:hypothetical protein